ncbi:MAG: short-chain dehydrogenase [Rhodobacterales bacterium]|nr:MAG: short-chain dehydrogenase [Rhodobacterales bacterium]
MGETLKRLISEGFRVFFLSAGVFAVVAVGWWGLYLAGLADDGPFEMAPVEWHAHELVFGYGGAALGGFLLTAVPNWTGAKGVPHLFIGTVAALWLAGRLALWFSAVLPPVLVALVDLAFLPVLWVKVLMLLLKRPKPANMVFLLFLSLLWLSGLATHLGFAGIWPDGTATGTRAGLLGLAGMILVIGGRVAPAFTRNAMNREGVSENALPRDAAFFTPLMIGAAAVLPLAGLALPGSPALALLMIAAGAAQLLRQMRWGAGFAATRPILATLHVSAALVALGLMLWGGAILTGGDERSALHLLAIGGVGGMTLAVMSRATLGHTGRPLVAPAPVALAYALLPPAALLRSAAPLLPGAGWDMATLAAALLWVLAFTLYTATLLPAFLRPRLPRAPMSPPPQAPRPAAKPGG